MFKAYTIVRHFCLATHRVNSTTQEISKLNMEKEDTCQVSSTQGQPSSPSPPPSSAQSSASYESCLDDQPDDCPICLDKIQNKVTTSCNHSFCKRCLRRWTTHENTCPTCREKIPWMRCYKGRLATFIGWKGKQDIHEMAENGFFSISDVYDAVQCVYCNTVFLDWLESDQPWKEHEEYRPLCPRVLFRHVFETYHNMRSTQ